MDIPLPDEDPPINESFDESLADIPVPEDTNRYSPSLPIEDDPPDFKNDIAAISLPSDTQKLPVPPTVSVLGKEAAKKRLLAFSQAKQSFISQKRKASIQTVLEGNVLKDNDAKSMQLKKKKKDKARDTISEIEELKRRENEVMETMQVLFPMWSNLDKKTTPVTSLIIQDGIVERSDRIESVVEKLLSKKTKHERKEQERLERLEERKRKKERREKEIRRLMPKSWTEFNKSGFKAYHFRRQKFRLEKLSEGMKSKERTRLHEHEREGSKRFNLLDSPMILKKPLVVSGVNNEDIEFPSWAVRYTNTWPPISYCINPKYDTRRFLSRKEMLSTLPDNIYIVIKKFLSSTSLNQFNEGKPESNRSWWKRDLYLIPQFPSNNLAELRYDITMNDHADNILEENLPASDAKLNELSDFSNLNKNEEFDKSSTKSLSDSIIHSSEGPNSDGEKSYSSEISEIEVLTVNRVSSIEKEDSKNEENLASEYEQFIKTIGPNTDDKETSERTGQTDEIWSDVSEDKDIFSGSSAVAKKKQVVEDRKKLKDKKLQKGKRKKVKKKRSKRSHSSDSSSSESSSSSSSSSSDSSSTTTTTSSSSSSGSSSSSSSSSSGSTSSSDSSSESESSSSTSSSGSTTSSGGQSLEGKIKKKLRRKRISKKKLISSEKNKSKKMAKVENDDEKAFVRRKKKRKDDLVTEGFEKSDNEAEVCDMKNLSGSPGKQFNQAELIQGEGQSLTSKPDIGESSIIIAEEKVNQEEIYELKDCSPQSRTSDDDRSTVSNSSLKSITSEPILSNEQKDTNNSLHWNSGEESVSNLPVEPDIHQNDSDKPPEGKRHFNIDMFQESHNCTSDVGSARQSPVENLSHSDSKEESKEENYNTNSRVLPQSGEESALKSLERYSPTAEDEDEEEYVDFLTNSASGGGSTLDEASSQLVSFGVNSASEEARMLDIPLPPPIEAPSEAPTSFRNILQLPSSPNQQPHQSDIKKKNVVLVGKSPVARLTFGKQVMKLKPINIFSTEDSDSEADKTPFPPSSVSETNDTSLPSSSGVLETKEDNYTQESVNSSQIANETINNQGSVADVDDSNVDPKPVNVVIDSSSPLSKKSRWDQEKLKSEERDCIGDVAERSLLINPTAELSDNSERKNVDYHSAISVPGFLEKVKGKSRKEDSRSPAPNDKKRKRERSHSSERERRRRERAWSPRDRARFPRGRRRDFRKRSRSKERRGRRESPHREFSPGWRKASPQNKSSRRSLSQEEEQRNMFQKSLRAESIVTNHELPSEQSPAFDSSWNKSEVNLNEVKDSYNSPPKKKESLSDWDSPERKYSPSSRKESPKRKKSPVSRDSPFRSPRRKESPLRKRTPENRKESPNRRYSPRRSPLPWKRSSPDRRRSPYSPRRSPPMRRRVSPDRKRPSSPPYRRRLSPSPDRKYSGRYMRKSPIKHQAYPDSPSREEKWKWDEDKGTEKRSGVESERFPKWDYEVAQGDAGSDYQTSLADSTISDSELVKEPPSPKRMSLDERLKIELGHTNTNIEPEQPQTIPAFHNFYYPPPAVPDPVGYFPHQQYSVNPQPPPCLPPDWNPSLHPPQLPNKLVQVGNVLQVVPTEIPVEPVFSAPPPKVLRNVEVLQPKVLQVGNVLQVVPSQEPPPPPPPQTVPLQFNTNIIAPPSPVAAPIPKITAPPSQPVPPVSIISLPFPPGSPNVFLKLEEKERRKKEKELRKEKKEQKVARRMLRKAMLKKKLAQANEADNEANACGAEAVDNESGELNAPKAAVVLPSPDKGILIGLKDTIVLTTTKKKSVSFADGIRPGEGTSPSGGEEHPLSPPPLIRKPVKKRKKRKVKVRIIRIDSSNSKEEESEEDELSPPPPPPGTPPPEAYIEYTASGRYLYPVSTSQPFPGNQDTGTVFPPLPAVTASPAAVVQFTTPPLPQPR